MSYAVANPGFPSWGSTKEAHQLIILANFPQELHENEKKYELPLDPPPSSGINVLIYNWKTAVYGY